MSHRRSAKQRRDPNQGEGDRISARRYDEHAREFIAEGRVADAAMSARVYVDRDPADAAGAEARAEQGPSGPQSSVEHLVAKGHTVLERIQPTMGRAVRRVRSRLARTRRAIGDP